MIERCCRFACQHTLTIANVQERRVICVMSLCLLNLCSSIDTPYRVIESLDINSQCPKIVVNKLKYAIYKFIISHEALKHENWKKTYELTGDFRQISSC